MGLALSLVLGACSNTVGSEGEMTFVVAQPSSPPTLDPHYSNTAVAFTPINAIFEGLVRLDETGEILPALAESWEWLDNQTLEFTIREGVYFHNGDPLTMEDIAFSLERAATSPVSSTMLGGINTTSIQITGENSIRFSTYEPFFAILAHLGANGSIVSQRAVEELGADFGHHPVGTGAFKVERFVQGDQLELVRFEEYYGEAPQIDRLIFRAVPEATNRVILLETGEVQMAMNVLPSDISRVEDSPGLTLLRNTNLRAYSVHFNNEAAPFDNVLVRQALNYAIDTQMIIDTVLDGVGTALTGPLAPEVWGANTGLEGYPFNPERARDLLAEAGYEGGFATRIYSNSDSLNQAVVTVIAHQLAQVGIDAEIIINEPAVHLELMRYGNYTMALSGFTTTSFDADRGLIPMFDSASVMNNSNYSNPEVDRLLFAGRSEQDLNQRMAYFHEAQEIIVDEAPWAFLYSGENLVGIRNEVRGLILHASPAHRFNDVYLER